jgi:hypothetical protein
MENEELTTSQEEVAENIDSTNDEEVETTTVESDDPYAEKTLEDYKALEKKNKELYERAKKAEALAKVAKSKPINKTNETPTGLTREEAILIAKGVNEDIINQAAIVAKAKGVSLMDAMADPLIEAYSAKIKADEKREKAQLGASRSSGSRGDNGDLTQRVGMTEEEHRKAIGM